jgi:hypothetical protein
MRIGAGMRRTSGIGGGAPVKNCRHTAAPKQKALNSTSRVPVPMIIQVGTTPSSNFLAPMPLASAASPVRTQAA